MTTNEPDPAPRPDLGALTRLILERGYERRDPPFRLSSGALSHDYLDLRRAVARGDGLALVAGVVVDRLGALGVDFDAIGGMTMGADPVAHAVALVTGRSWYSVRKAEKAHGTGRRVEGAALGPSTHVVLFEDTVSTGASMLDACSVVAETGASIEIALTLVDRGVHAARSFAARSVRYVALLTYEDLGLAPLAASGSTAAADLG